MKLKTLFVIFPVLAILAMTAGNGLGRVVLYEEHFTGGETDLEWESAWLDSLGNPLTPMETDSVPQNPSGDGWVGVVVADQDNLGGLGMAIAGDASLTDYSMEAEIWVDFEGSFYEGIMIRVNRDTSTTPETVTGYQFASNFYPPFFIQQLRFRKWSIFQSDIRVIRDYAAGEIPGGAPTEPGWHTFKIDAQGDSFWLYWDDQELPDNPQVDTTQTAPFLSGNFGIYSFNQFGPTSTTCDDIIIEGEPQGVGDTPGDIQIPRAFFLSQNYPNPFNPMTTIRVDIPEGQARHAVLAIYDMRGRRIRTLADKPLDPGTHLFAWDGRDSSGRTVPSGTYIYRMKQGEDQFTRKMLLMK